VLLTVIGPDGRFKHLAPRFAPTFGYAEAELLEQPFISFIHPADQAATRAALEKLAQGEPTLGLENRFRCKDESFRRLAWTALPTREGLLCAVAHDITDRTVAAQQRGRALTREQAAAVVEKEEFLATVCHDLQQPLTVILAQAQLMQRQLTSGELVDPERVRARLAHISAAAAQMHGMTQDLLDLWVQDSGRPLVLLLGQDRACRTHATGGPRTRGDDQPHVFDRFHRGSNVVGRFAGSGLGYGMVTAWGGAGLSSISDPWCPLV
jgi:PAS domain S-box-containing protein